MSVKKTIRDISALLPNAQRACNLFMAECKRQGLNVLITETYRTQERQDYLYAQGRTRKGNKVTWTKYSRHTSRRAWDICKNLKGHEYSDTEFFYKCGEIARELGITWGGDWTSPDMPHFEVSEVWNYRGDEPMKEDERKKFNEIVDYINKTKNKMIYNYIDKNMPEWAREGVQYCVDKGFIQGTGDGLGLDDKDLKYCTIIMRLHKSLEG